MEQVYCHMFSPQVALRHSKLNLFDSNRDYLLGVWNVCVMLLPGQTSFIEYPSHKTSKTKYFSSVSSDKILNLPKAFGYDLT